MTRMRGIKPDLLKHEALCDLEASTGLPVRLGYIALIMCADRDGRFLWRPRSLKAEALPFDDKLDFAAVLDVLAAAGFVRKYDAAGEPAGWIPKFRQHQNIPPKERKSIIPPHPEDHCTATALQLQCNSSAVPKSHDSGNGPALEESAGNSAWNGYCYGKGMVTGKEVALPRQGEGPHTLNSSHPSSAEEVLEFARSAGMPWVARHAAKWFDHMSERGWMLGEKGTIPCRDWRSACRKAANWVVDAVAREKLSASETGQRIDEKKSTAPPVPERRGPAAPPQWQAIYAEEMDVAAHTAPHSWSLVPADLQRRIVTAAERSAA